MRHAGFKQNWKDIASSLLKLGATAYGGPAIMGIMQAELQEKRKWVSKERFLEGLSVANMLPGATATQLGIFLGYARGGWWGGLIGGLCFVVPAFFIMLALTVAYATLGVTPIARGALYGLGPVVIAIAGVGIYVSVFWHSKLYADMGLQFVYIALSIYGWYEWLHGGENKSELRVTRGWRSSYPIALAITIAFALGLGTFLRKTTDAALPYADASLTSFSLLAQWMMTKKYIENWWVWIAVDVFYVAMFTFKHLYLTAVLYVIFIGVCWFAYVEWRSSLSVPADELQNTGNVEC